MIYIYIYILQILLQIRPKVSFFNVQCGQKLTSDVISDFEGILMGGK